MVTGGRITALNNPSDQNPLTDTTEILTKGASAWVFSKPLPSQRYAMSASTLDNKLIVAGKYLKRINE